MRQLLRPIRSKIQYTVILPYLLLMTLVMLVGSGIAVLLVANSWQERFNNQLGQVARNFTESFALREINNIEYLRQIIFTAPNAETGAPSVPQAMRAGDTDGLAQAMQGLWVVGLGRENVSQDRLIVFDTRGIALLDWERSSLNPREPAQYIGTDLSNQPLVKLVLQGASTPVPGSDVVGDKYSGLISFRAADGRDSLHFFTVVPVYVTNPSTGAEELIGGLLVAQRLDNLLLYLQTQSQAATSTIYDVNGVALISTLTGIDLPSLDMSQDLILELAQLNAPDRTATTSNPANAGDPCLDIGNLTGRQVTPLERTPLPSCSVNTIRLYSGREYQVVFAPLLIRGVQSGYFSIGLSRDFVVSAWSSSRNGVLAVTVALALLSVYVGTAVARRITRPLGDLVDTAEAVTAGNLERRSSVQQENELGKLSHAFNQMTEHLLRLYTVSRELNRTIEIDRVLAVATESSAAFVPGTEAAALLEMDGAYRLLVSNDSSETLRALTRNPVTPDLILSAFDAQEQTATNLVLLGGPEREALGLHTVGLQTAYAAPVYAQRRLAGVLLFTHAADAPFQEAALQSLVVIANMAVAVLSNALLYAQVQQDAKERQAILTSIGDGVVVCDERGRIVMLNQAAEQMLDLPDWRATRPRLADLPLEAVAQSQELFGRVGEQFRLGLRSLTLTRSPVVAEDGTTRGEVLVLHDVTEAVAMDKAKTDFIATISHELRTPLTVIRGYTELLLRGSGGQKPTADQTELLDQVRVRAVEMSDMVNNAILIADLEAGRLQTDLAPQDVEMVVNMALAPMRNAFDTKQLSITIDVPSDIPAVLADREQLKRALAQLLDNARRYTDTGGVTVRARAEDSVVQIDVIDTGQGIAPEVLPMLFKRFQRIEGNNSAQRGGGLGLAITKQLIERQNGRVGAVSTPGAGSTFSITLVQAHEHSLAVAQPNDTSSASQ